MFNLPAIRMQTSVEDIMAGKRYRCATMTRKFVLPKVSRKADAHARERIHCRT